MAVVSLPCTCLCSVSAERHGIEHLEARVILVIYCNLGQANTLLCVCFPLPVPMHLQFKKEEEETHSLYVRLVLAVLCRASKRCCNITQALRLLAFGGAAIFSLCITSVAPTSPGSLVRDLTFKRRGGVDGREKRHNRKKKKKLEVRECKGAGKILMIPVVLVIQ